MNTAFHIVTFIAVVAFFIFIVATSLGFGPGSPDQEQLEEARTLLAEDEAQLVDVRTPREFADNGLDGAINIPVQQLDQRLDELDDSDEPIAVYCRSGNRSSKARQILKTRGFEHVYDLGDHRTAAEVVDEAR